MTTVVRIAGLRYGFSLVSAPSADAARQENWRHSGSSQVTSVLDKLDERKSKKERGE